MEAKQKAKELVRQYWHLGNMDIVKSKVCAFIAINEIIFELKIRNCNVKYFEEVKIEIEKL